MPSESQLQPKIAQAVKHRMWIASPDPDEQATCSVDCEFSHGERAIVEVRAAPIKTVSRMREKLSEYVSEFNEGPALL